MPIQQIAFDAQFVVVDLLDLFVESDPATAAGVATAQFDPTGAVWWRIGHAVVQLSAERGSTLLLYTADQQNQNLLDGTTAGDLDVGDFSSPLLVPPSSYLRAVWSGCTAGDVGTIRVQGEKVELRRVPIG